MSTWQAFREAHGIPDIPAEIVEYIADRERLAADLITCLDFCDAIGEEIIRPPAGREPRYGYQGLAIRHAVALARQIASGEPSDYSQVEFELADWEKRDINPDVRRRMADVLARAERMVE